MPTCMSYQATAIWPDHPVKLEDLRKPAIPIAYGRLILDVATALGVPEIRLLSEQGISAELLADPEARLSVLQANSLLYRALRLSGNPALGYEIGLHSGLTTHGFIGYGLMSQPTLRAGIDFGARFLQLRLPNLSLRSFERDGMGVIEVSETLPMGAVRTCMLELFLVGLWRMASFLSPGEVRENRIELAFDFPEPAHYAGYRTRLPPVRFQQPANQLRFPLALLDAPLRTADPTTAQLVARQCAQELSRLGYAQDFLVQVRALLVAGEQGYPNLEQLAAALHVSARTMKRRLQDHGLSFQPLLDEVRRRDALNLLADPTLSIEDVARRIGFSDPANFTRAFRKWTGQAPSALRRPTRS